MTFVLKLFFSGLMAFVPSQDGHELTVLLLNVDHNYHLSDGSSLAHHKPLLVARAGGCSGDCPNDDADLAQFLYADQSQEAALASLQAAVAGGGAWQLSGSDISVNKGSGSDPDLPALQIRRNVRMQIIPTTPAEREDFDWIASLGQLGSTFDSSTLATPPPGLVAARFKLHSGSVFTYSVARIGSNVTPVHFQRLDGTGAIPSYSQAMATWVGAEIAVSADSIEIADAPFDGSAGRTMSLTPDANGKMEIAVLNLPPFVPPAEPSTATPAVGAHFEMYYELAQTPPQPAARLVPYAGAAPDAPELPAVDWHDIHPQDVLWSDLLNALRLNIGRTVYEQVLCPPIRP
ncbi:MAG TPA: hypothetical protein VEO74_16980 [Thermoanaerobaculia bacterium]|nr:hypothetical protein [Thermoanaerobaculia bacterium]